ncbi:uncharacterized protein HKW66_Vig0041180 [Vigna angularis]|uniref:NusB/RsmB/TIM44 domain-containing protein n=1 Tax=Phaseolus angularis TaxID=3914 RepID=A0A8T0LB68_PHAAN|nr:uncharacterized protein HKW66_Vig0041180 [Vigna angularis]
MEGVLLPVCSSPSSSATLKPKISIPQRSSFTSSLPTHCSFPQNVAFSLRNTLRSSTSALAQHEAPVLGKPDNNSVPALPKIDKTGRFCSPRAARELALSIIYAACLEGMDPVRLFEKRMNARREAGYEFDKKKLLEYNHMSFGGPPATVESDEEANELLRHIEEESAIARFCILVLFTRKLLVAVRDTWDNHVLVINKIVPENWKNEPAGKILELCILHLAMSEMAVLETRHQIVINEAVDLAKRFCDGAAPRIINGCLRTFFRELELQESNNRV